MRSILYISAVNIKRWIYYVHHSSDTRANGTKRWRTTVKVGLSRSQFRPSFSQPSVRRQCVIALLSVSESAANQNAPINKDSKSPNPRSLKQHTPAEPISPCCFCSCPTREIGRFHILICRYLRGQGPQQGSHSHGSRTYILPSLFIFRSPAFAFISPRLPHLLWDFQRHSWPATHLRFSQWIPSQCRPIRRSGIVASGRSLEERRG